MGRNKSWVSRRLSLIERLSEELQDEIRLGLLSVSVGRELWEIIEPKQSKPVGFQAQLISMHGICKSVSEGFKKISPEKRRELSEFISRAVGAAQEVVQILGGGNR